MEKIYNDVIIADTSGLISLFVPSDRNHAVAVAAAQRLQNAHKDIIIINAVYVEFLNVMGRQFGHETAIAAAHELTAPFILVNEPQDIPASEALEKFAIAPNAVSFTDCLIMAAADGYWTKDIFGFDKQFA